MRRTLSFILLSLVTTSCASPGRTSLERLGKQADYVVIEKSGRSVTLWSEGEVLKSYPVLSLGSNPFGHKMHEGDGRTPEGLYLIDEKHDSKQFQKFLRISYPNEDDKLRAQKLGVDPGGMVGIHGDKGGLSGFFDRMKPNWTAGCITVQNNAIKEIYDLVAVGTPILIKP
jgi:murein L,D-transpeptidase YafK